MQLKMRTPLWDAATRKLVSAVDHAVFRGALTPLPTLRDPVEALTHHQRMDGMSALLGFYDRPEHFDADGPLFTRLADPQPEERRVRSYRGGHIIDLSWASEFTPMWSAAAAETRYQELVRTRSRHGHAARDALDRGMRVHRDLDRRLGPLPRYQAVERNRTMHARWFRHTDGPRPCAVILHGYLGGHLAVEEHMWPIPALFDGGMDVVLTVLPHHGPRANPRRGLRLPDFPSSDPRWAVEGFRHMVHDHLTLFDYLLNDRVQSLGAIGMSLGGYSAALLATIEHRLEFGIFYMPLSSIADFARRNGRMVGSNVHQEAQTRALDRIYRIVSPLSRPSLLSPGRAIVIAGESDMITGTAHGQQLAAHFDACTSTFAGGHILQLGRGAALAPMWQMLRQAGLWSP
ncbi:MAG: hypothetical protein OXU20_20650 [Myxococcales bacterium]|nr:hypothetical protein [Myxococcales bacterium]